MRDHLLPFGCGLLAVASLCGCSQSPAPSAQPGANASAVPGCQPQIRFINHYNAHAQTIELRQKIVAYDVDAASPLRPVGHLEDVDGKPAEAPREIVTLQSIDKQDVKGAMSLTGQPLVLETVLSQLHYEQPVLIVPPGKRVDSAYCKLFRDNIVVLEIDLPEFHPPTFDPAPPNFSQAPAIDSPAPPTIPPLKLPRDPGDLRPSLEARPVLPLAPEISDGVSNSPPKLPDQSPAAPGEF